jgi:carbamate kinase
MRQIKWLLERGCVVICAGGGGIPTMYRPGRQLVGVEAVIDKDHASGLLARDVGADFYVMATDADAVYLDFKRPGQRAIARTHPDALMEYAAQFPAGSMLPKVVAACDFARASSKRAAIGALSDIEEMLAGTAGTIIGTEFAGIAFRSA